MMTTVCVKKLIEVGIKYEIYSYSLCVEKVFGKKGRLLIDLMIMLTQFSFTISQMAFMLKSLKSSVNQAFEVETEMWLYASILICILTPIAWVRDISKFSFSFMMGNLLILLTIVTVSFYAIQNMHV